jgi:hypothetical protein
MKNDPIRMHSTNDLYELGKQMSVELWEQLRTTPGWATAEVNGQTVAYPVGWFADDNHADAFFPVKNPETAAKRFADGGEWGEIEETIWVASRCYRAGLTAKGEVVSWDETDRIKVAIDPEEPDCEDARGHDWQAPHEIVGGIEENPGVIGHGGGVFCEEVCIRCGCSKLTDTWAHDPADGQQGLQSIRYEAGKYAEDVVSLYSDQEDDEG